MASVAQRERKALFVEPATTRLAAVGRSSMLWLPLGLITLIGIVRLSLPLGRTFTSGGDVAFLELQVRQTLHGVVGVGPYSRFGWHDPGPAMFYLFAPLYWLTGESSRSLFLSAWLLNLGSALLVVALVRRRFGVLAGWVTVAALLLFVREVEFHRLIDPWNPSILAVPMLLVAVSAVATFDGDTWGLLALVASTTFVVQTYVATVPVAAFFFLTGVGGYLWSRYRNRSSSKPAEDEATRPALASRAAMAGIASLVALAWALPVGQQLFGSQGNLALFLKFELHPPPTAVHHHSLHEALAAVSDTGTVIGLGQPRDLAAHGSRLVLICVYAIVGVAVALWWTRHGSRFMAALAATTPIGVIVAVAGGTRVTGPIYSYMFRWCSVLPVPVLIALGVAVARGATEPWRARRGNVWLPVGLGTAAIAAAAVPALRTTLTSPSTSFSDFPGARLAAHQIEAAVGSPARVFKIRLVDLGASDGPVILTLVKDGYHFRLEQALNLYGGDTGRPVQGPTFTVAHGNTALPTVVTG